MLTASTWYSLLPDTSAAHPCPRPGPLRVGIQPIPVALQLQQVGLMVCTHAVSGHSSIILALVASVSLWPWRQREYDDYVLSHFPKPLYAGVRVQGHVSQAGT